MIAKTTTPMINTRDMMRIQVKDNESYQFAEWAAK